MKGLRKISYEEQHYYEFCKECDQKFCPLEMTDKQLEIWERTGLCAQCQKPEKEA